MDLESREILRQQFMPLPAYLVAKPGAVRMGYAGCSSEWLCMIHVWNDTYPM